MSLEVFVANATNVPNVEKLGNKSDPYTSIEFQGKAGWLLIVHWGTFAIQMGEAVHDPGMRTLTGKLAALELVWKKLVVDLSNRPTLIWRHLPAW